MHSKKEQNIEKDTKKKQTIVLNNGTETFS